MNKTQQFGGTKGDAFDDRDLGTLGKIDRIDIHHGDWINAVQFYYRGLDAAAQTFHGTKEGGKTSVFKLDDDEFVTDVELRQGNNNGMPVRHPLANMWIFALRFTTTKIVDGGPRKSPWYGLHSNTNSWTFLQLEKVHVRFGEGNFLTAVFGRAGWDKIEAIGFRYDEDPVVSVMLEDMVLDPTSVAPANQPPDIVARIVAKNGSSVQQTAKKSVSTSVSNTHKFTKTLGFKEGTGFKIGGGKVVKAEWSVTFEANQSYQWGEDTSVARTDTVELTATVPPKKEMVAILQNQKGTFNATYKATQVSTHRSGHVASLPITGQFEGLIASQTSYLWLPEEDIGSNDHSTNTWNLAPTNS